jgi:hypothetical protein
VLSASGVDLLTQRVEHDLVAKPVETHGLAGFVNRPLRMAIEDVRVGGARPLDQRSTDGMTSTASGPSAS